MTLGELIKEYRSTHGLSQRKFALKANITNTYVSALESNYNPNTGKKIAPTIAVIQNVAAAMDLTLDELMQQLGQSKEQCISLTLNESSAEADDETQELIAVFGKLNSMGKKALLILARALAAESDYVNC